MMVKKLKMDFFLTAKLAKLRKIIRFDIINLKKKKFTNMGRKFPG